MHAGATVTRWRGGWSVVARLRGLVLLQSGVFTAPHSQRRVGNSARSPTQPLSPPPTTAALLAKDDRTPRKRRRARPRPRLDGVRRRHDAARRADHAARDDVEGGRGAAPVERLLLAVVRHGPVGQPQPRPARQPVERLVVVDVHRVLPVEPDAQLELAAALRRGRPDAARPAVLHRVSGRVRPQPDGRRDGRVVVAGRAVPERQEVYGAVRGVREDVAVRRLPARRQGLVQHRRVGVRRRAVRHHVGGEG